MSVVISAYLLLNWLPFWSGSIELGSPPIGAFKKQGYLNVVTYSGGIYKIKLSPGSENFYTIVDSLKFIRDSEASRVKNAVYWRNRLVLLTDDGLWVSDTSERFSPWKLLSRKPPVALEGNSQKLYLLFRDSLCMAEVQIDNKIKIKKIGVITIGNFVYTSITQDNLFIISEDTLWVLMDTMLRKIPLKIPQNGKRLYILKEIEKFRGWPAIFGNDKFIAQDSATGYIIVYEGSVVKQPTNKSEFFRSFYLLLDGKLSVVDTFSIPDFFHRDMFANNGMFWLLGEKSIFGGAIYRIAGIPPALEDSFSTKLEPRLGISVAHNLNFTVYKNGFISIFNTRTPLKPFIVKVSAPDIPWRVFKLPLIHDNPIDFVLFMTTFNSNLPFDQRNNGIVLVVPRIDESLDYAASLVGWAEGHQFPWSARAALDSLDAAMEIYRVLDPDRLTHLFKLRNRLYLQVRLMEMARAYWLRLLFALIWAFTIFMFLKARQAFRRFKAQYAPLPAEETIKSVLRIPIFHKFPSLWQPLMERGDFSCETLKDDTLHRNLLDSLQMLVAIEKEFRNVHPRWETLFKKAKNSLLLLSYIFRLQRLCRLGGIVRNVFRQAFVGSLNAIAHAREELKTLLEKGRADIIQGALLPVIEDIRRKYSAQGVIVNTEISQQASYTFYPSELAKFKSCFRAILENAVEAYSDDGTLKKIEIKASALPDVLKISIRDYGRGMDPDTISEIFKPGFSHGKHGEGRGYGLAGCDELFRKYGEVEVHSEPGRGTTFNIKIYFLPPRR